MCSPQWNVLRTLIPIQKNVHNYGIIYFILKFLEEGGG